MNERFPLDLGVLATMVRRSVDIALRMAADSYQAEAAKLYAERVRNPQVGDLVAEISSIHSSHHPAGTDLDGVGILERIEMEPVDFGDPDFVWSEEENGRPHPTEKVFYIRTFDGRLFRWVNATIVAAGSEF